MPIHPRAAEGFQDGAWAYERGRPDYPPEAIRWLTNRVGLAGSCTALDLAAGTGKLTRLLLATGARVIAVEPVPAMRQVLAASTPGAEVIGGTAEAIPMRHSSTNVVTVGQAFHWFSADVALQEIHRVLKPTGTLVLVWNRRRLDAPLQARLEDIISTHRQGVPSHRYDEWRRVFSGSQIFGQLDEVSFDHRQVVDADGLIDRVRSISFICSLPGDQREAALKQVRSLAERWDKPLALDYSAEIQVCTRT